jgi:hypothetical protein
MRANQVLNAQEIETLKQKETIFRNASNTAKQRETALNDWIAIRKEAAARELKIEQDLNTSLLNEIKNRPNLKGITDQEIGGFVTIYAKNPELMKKAEELSKIYSGMAEWDTADKIAKLRKEIEQLLPEGITFESLMSSVRLNSALSGKQIDALSDSYKRLATAQGGGAQVEAEAARWLGSIINKGEEADKKLNDLKTQIDTLKTSLETANEADRKGIAAKIILLEKELKLRENIVKQALIAAEFGEGFVPTQLAIPGMPSVLPKKKTKQKTWNELQEEMTALKPFNKKTFDDEKKRQKELSEDEQKALDKQLKLRQEIVNAVADLINQIGQQIGLDEKSMALLNAGLNAFTALASGDIVGAALAMLSGIIAQIPSAASRFEAQIEHINQLLKELERLIELSEQKGGQAPARKGELKYLQDKEAAEKKEYERLQEQARIHLDLLGWRQDKADEAYATWQATTDEIEDSNAALTEFYTDTTALAIADAISQGFQDGKTSAADFADTFNGFMISAINSALEEMSKPEIAAWYKQFAIDMESGGGLTPEEIAALKIDWDKIIAEGKANRDAVEGVTGINLNTGDTAKQGLSGIVRQITEETGSELAGLFRRFADDERKLVDYGKLGVNHLIGIEANTYGSWQELIKANVKLDTVNVKLDTVVTNTKPLYAGDL